MMPGKQLMPRFIVAILLVCPVFILGCANPPPKPEPGLHVVEYDKDGYIQAAPDVNWSRYTQVQVEKASVEFREHWARDLKRRDGTVITERDEARIKSDMSGLLSKVFSRELLNEGSWVLTEDVDANVLRFTPRIVDLDIYAPDRVRDYIGGALADSKGRMTLELDIYDSMTGRLIATTRQRQEDPYDGCLESANSTSNHVAFRLMMDRWATWFFEMFDLIRADTTQ